MKEHQQHEWISIGDFMAGMVGVLILFFVIAVLISVVSKAEANARKKEGVAKVMSSISEVIKNRQVKGMEVLPAQGVLRLKDQSFDVGSACLDVGTANMIAGDIASIVENAMEKDGRLKIQIEGHSDTAPVNGVVSDSVRFCAVFDDNYTLSAGRAREARRALIKGFKDGEKAKKISVVGFGPDQLIDSSSPKSSVNRRVEIRFLWQEDKTSGLLPVIKLAMV